MMVSDEAVRTGDCFMLRVADDGNAGGNDQGESQQSSFLFSTPADPRAQFTELRCCSRVPQPQCPQMDSAAFQIVACANDDQVTRLALLQQEQDLIGEHSELGSSVHYGQHVRLQHVSSGRLMSVCVHHQHAGGQQFSMGIGLNGASAAAYREQAADAAASASSAAAGTAVAAAAAAGAAMAPRGSAGGAMVRQGSSLSVHQRPSSPGRPPPRGRGSVHSGGGGSSSSTSSSTSSTSSSSSRGSGSGAAGGGAGAGGGGSEEEDDDDEGEAFFNSWFRVESPLRSRKVGDLVRANDTVLLRNTRWRRFLCVPSALGSSRAADAGAASAADAAEPVAPQSDITNEASAAFEPSRFSLTQYSTFNAGEPRALLHADDWVWLQHCETQAFLSNEVRRDAVDPVGADIDTAAEAAMDDDGSKLGAVLAESTGGLMLDEKRTPICWNCGKRPDPPHFAAECEEMNLDALPECVCISGASSSDDVAVASSRGQDWARSSDNDIGAAAVGGGAIGANGEFGGGLMSVWQLESARVVWSGGPLQPLTQVYCLRQVATGRLLACSPGTPEKKETARIYTVAAADASSEACSFRLARCGSNRGAAEEDELNAGDSMQLQHVATSLWLCHGQQLSSISCNNAVGYDVQLRSQCGDSDCWVATKVPLDEKVRIEHVLLAMTCLQTRFAAVEECVSSGKLCTDVAAAPLCSVLQDVAELLLATSLVNVDNSGHQRRAGGQTYFAQLQNLIREQRLVPKLLTRLQNLLGFTGKLACSVTITQLHDQEQSGLRSIFKAVFELVAIAVRRNLRSKLAIAHHVRFIQGLLVLGKGLNASEALSELFSDNLSFLLQDNAEHINSTVGLIRKKGMLPQFVHFLHQLCSHNGAAIPRNQALIRHALLQNAEALLPRTWSKEEVVVANDVNSSHSSRRTPKKTTVWFADCSQFSGGESVVLPLNATVVTDCDKLRMQYYTAVLRLLGQLCLGRNEESQKTVRSLVGLSFEQVLQICQDRSLLPEVRSAFCELMLRVFVECEPNDVVSKINLVRTWNDPVSTLVMRDEGSNVTYGLFAFCMQFLRVASIRLEDWQCMAQGAGDMVSSSVHKWRNLVNVRVVANNWRNRSSKRIHLGTKKAPPLAQQAVSSSSHIELTLHVLQLCRVAVLYGFFIGTDQEEEKQRFGRLQRLFDILIDILQSLAKHSTKIRPRGRARTATQGLLTPPTEQPREGGVVQTGGSLDESSLMVMLECCHTLDLLLDVRLDLQLSTLLHKVSKLPSERLVTRGPNAFPNAGTSTTESDNAALIRCESSAAEGAKEPSAGDNDVLQDADTAQNIWQSTISASHLDRRRRLVPALLGLTQFSQPELTSKVFGLLFRHFSGGGQLLHSAKAVHLINESAAPLHREIASMVSQVRRLAAVQRSAVQSAKLCQLLGQLAQRLDDRDDKTLLHGVSAREAESVLACHHGVGAIVEVLAMSGRPRDAVQSIAEGVHGADEEYAARARAEEQRRGQEVACCCKLLLEMLLIHPATNQKLLFPHVDLLLQHMPTHAHLVGVIIVAIFCKNYALVTVVTEPQFHTLVCYVTEHESEAAKFLHVLRQLVCCGNRTVQRNQNLVLDHLFRDAASTLRPLASADLLEVCVDEKSVDSSAELIRLLAACSAGKNHFAQVQCRSLVSIEQATRAIIDPSAPMALRNALMQLVDAVFFDVQVSVRALETAAALWDLLDFCAAEISVFALKRQQENAAATDDEAKQDADLRYARAARSTAIGSPASFYSKASPMHQQDPDTEFICDIVPHSLVNLFQRYLQLEQITGQHARTFTSLRTAAAALVEVNKTSDEKEWAEDLLAAIPVGRASLLAPPQPPGHLPISSTPAAAASKQPHLRSISAALEDSQKLKLRKATGGRASVSMARSSHASTILAADDITVGSENGGIEMSFAFVENVMYQRDIQSERDSIKGKLTKMLVLFEEHVHEANEISHLVSRFQASDEYVSRLIAQLGSMGSEHTRVSQKDAGVDLFALQVLQSMVQTSSQSRAACFAPKLLQRTNPVGFGMNTWKRQPWAKDERMYREQCRLGRLGACEMVLRLLAVPVNTESREIMFHKALQLGIELLLNGNAEVQEEMRVQLAGSLKEPVVRSLVRFLRCSATQIREKKQQALVDQDQQPKAAKKASKPKPKPKLERANTMFKARSRSRTDAKKEVERADDAAAGAPNTGIERDLLEFLRLLCLGHFTPLQRWLAVNNIVEEVLTYLRALRWEVDAAAHSKLRSSLEDKCVDTCCLTLKTLSAFVQGCAPNQSLLASTRLLSALNALLKESHLPKREQCKKGADDAEHEMPEQQQREASKVAAHQRLSNALEHVGAHVVRLLHSLVEGCHDQATIRRVLQGIDKPVLFAYCEELSARHLDAARSPAAVDAAGPHDVATNHKLRVAWLRTQKCDAIVTVSTLRDLGAQLGDYDAALDEILDTLCGGAAADGAAPNLPPMVASVEIMRECRLERLYFRVPDLCRRHWNDISIRESVRGMKYNFKTTDNHREKLYAFHERCGFLLLEMAYCARLAASSFRGRVTRRAQLWKDGALIASFVINGINIALLQTRDGEWPRGIWTCGLVVALLHLLLAVVRWCAHLLSRKQRIKNTYFHTRWRKDEEARRAKSMASAGPEGGADLLSTIFESGEDAAADGDGQAIAAAGGGGAASAPTPASASASAPHHRSFRASELPCLGGGDSSADMTDPSMKSALEKLEKGILTEEEYSQIVEGGRRWEQLVLLPSDGGGAEHAAAEAQRAQLAGVIPLPRLALLLASDSVYELGYLLLSLAGFCIWCRHDWATDEQLSAIRFVLYSFHLLDICARDSSLERILSAVTLNGSALLQTGLLAAVLIYIYAGVGFSFFRGDYDVAGRELGGAGGGDAATAGAEHMGCRTFGECLLTHLNVGLRSDQGVADVMDNLDYAKDSTSHTLFRLLFDVSYWVIIVVMLLSIVSGIIIDTFGQLRDRKDKVDKELARGCFICGNDSNSFQRSGRGFDFHVAHEHNMWAYMFVRQYLRERNPLHFTGQERYLNDRMREDDISFFPMGQALALSADGGNPASSTNNE